MVSIGFIAALVFAALVFLFLVGTIWLLHGKPTHEDHWWDKRGDPPLTGEGAFRRTTIVVCTLVLLGFVLGLYPYEKEHHWYLEYTETVVAKDDATFSVNEDQSYRIELENGIVFRSKDYRFIPVQVGDTITVHCIVAWIYNEADRYGCRFGGAP